MKDELMDSLNKSIGMFEFNLKGKWMFYHTQIDKLDIPKLTPHLTNYDAMIVPMDCDAFELRTADDISLFALKTQAYVSRVRVKLSDAVILDKDPKKLDILLSKMVNTIYRTAKMTATSYTAGPCDISFRRPGHHDLYIRPTETPGYEIRCYADFEVL